MTPERWEEVGRLFQAVVVLKPEERSAFLNQACGDDKTLRSEVESLLAIEAPAADFLDAGAMQEAAKLLAEEKPPSPLGQKLGQYEVLSLIGSGGMGDVYKARHLTLNNNVALKFLPASVGQDVDRLRRFKQEARAASALNHPNIVTIHDFAEVNDWRFIVSEYVEGETLRERLRSGPMDINDALDVATQIASGLAAAHGVGVIHRDIKPENIMVRRDGYVKVLDFGLAKLGENSATDLSTPPRSEMKTDTGVVMGTSRYMSPQQARGLTVDTRTDLWSLGVVLYEMVSGRAPFEGETNSDVLVSILEREPPPLRHQGAKVPNALERIVGKALCKDRDGRYQTAGELLTDLKSVSLEEIPRNRFSAKRLSLLTALLALVISGSLWFYTSPKATKPSLPPMKIVPFTSLEGEEYMPSFSPDGNQIAFGWNGENGGPFSIYVKQIGGDKPLRLTSDSSYLDLAPVWSPDGQRIAFIRSNEREINIFVVAALGGAARKIVTLGPHPGWSMFPTLAWSPDGKFIAVPYTEPLGPHKIVLVSPETFTTQTLTAPPVGSVGDFNPVFSPDGQSIAFFRMPSSSSADIYIMPVGGGEPRRLTFDNAFIRGLDWTADGRKIVFASNRSGITSPTDSSSLWSIPATGGTPEHIPLGGSNFWFPRVARQGNRLTYAQAVPDDSNIYRIEIAERATSKYRPTKLIASTRWDGGPQFSRDGRRIAFHSDRSGQSEIWTSDADGTNLMQLTSSGPNERAGTPRFSPNGQQIAFDLFNETNNGHIYVISADGGLPRPITTGSFTESLPSWSSDGKWIYFASDRAGHLEVWKAAAEGGEAVQVTRRGGYFAFESFDGQYLYYVKPFPTQGIWRVPVDGGEELQILDSFQSEYAGDWAVANNGIYFLKRNKKNGFTMEFFDFAARKTRQIASLGEIHIVESCCITVSPDGRQILYSQNDQQHSADITLVENFR